MPDFNTLSPPILPFLSRPVEVPVEDLGPVPGGISAFLLWGSLPRRAAKERLIARRVSGRWLWSGGFSGFPGPGEDKVMVRVLARRATSEAIREAMWREAVSGKGVRYEDIGLWQDLVYRHLPDDLMRVIFGSRGLNASSGASVFGISRQTMAKHLRARL